ncbi:ubiquitin-like small modifier protein SAMP2 [Natrialbaceae archaeon A-arb3/5]
MRVTVDVKGEDTHELELDEVGAATGNPDESSDAVGPTPTYADLLREIELSPHEVSVLVDGRPVPEDQPVESDHVTVLRLIKGGSSTPKGRSSTLKGSTDSRYNRT